jgi:MFS family permease
MQHLGRQQRKVVDLYREFPKPFWTLVGATFVDRLGGALLFPFFALYLTDRFQIGMSEVGVLFAIWSLAAFPGSLLGGALADRMGRKYLLIFSLLASSLSTLAMGFVSSLQAFYLLALVSGVFTEVGGPAYNAMVADLLPERQRAQGYGILRVAFNVSVVLGPAIGGLLAARSYLLLFVIDAVISAAVALFVWLAMPETRPAPHPDAKPESVGQTFAGYLVPLRDRVFLLFLLAGMLAWFVYMNMNTTLGVYLRDDHGIAENLYGLILSLNAIMVVFLQFPITRWIAPYRPMRVIAAGTALYAVGFAMYGVTSTYAMFLLAMVVITVGEMVIAPVYQAVVADLSPEAMRGRYMAVSGFAIGIPYAIGPLIAGNIMDNHDSRLLWYLCGVVGMISVLVYLYLDRLVHPAPRPAEAGLAADPSASTPGSMDQEAAR